jgi:hypothetical protein
VNSIGHTNCVFQWGFTLKISVLLNFSNLSLRDNILPELNLCNLVAVEVF